jgi:lipocalin
LYWVLAREPNLDEASIQHLLAIAAAHGYDTSCPIR